MDPPDMDAGRKFTSDFKNRAGYDRRRRPIIARSLRIPYAAKLSKTEIREIFRKWKIGAVLFVACSSVVRFRALNSAPRRTSGGRS